MKEKLYNFCNRDKYKSKNIFVLVLLFMFSVINAQQITETLPGTYNWTVPEGVTSVTVEVWGAGGAGQGVTGKNSAGGGGSGGGYVKATLNVVQGTVYQYSIGAGGSSGNDGGITYFGSATTIKAVGGKGAGAPITASNVGGAGAPALTTGNVIGNGAFLVNSAYGGKGGNAASNYSGGGGSSAGDGNNNGNDASGSTAGNAPLNGYAGGGGLTSGRSAGNPGGIGAGGSGGRTGNRDNDQLGGSGGNGQIVITYVIQPCSGTPAGGTASLSATTGAPNSIFTASVTGGSSTPGITYQWQSASSASGPWVDISGATGTGATITAASIVGTTYYRRVTTCTNSGVESYSTVVSYTTSISYCKPTSSNPSSLYIRDFQFVGTLNSVPANVQTGTSAYSAGYQDYTSLTPAQQPQNAAMNITAKTNGTSGGSWKAWVDWNRDGDFNDSGEEIYKMIGWTTPSITFGFIVPPTALGVYRLRIGTKSSASDFGNCDSLTGEYEDYLFEAVVDCPAKVLTINDVNAFDGERCGEGSVRISATGNASAVNYNWYDSVYGGTLLGTGNTYNTPSISTTTTYYVTAVSASGCETAYRYPVVARIDPQPTVTFSTDKPAICGEDEPTLLVTAAGDKYQDVIFEKFDSGLGVFKNYVAGAYTNSLGYWMNKPSPYIPTVAEGYAGTSPAFSSGYFGGNYAIINSDISRTTNVLNYMESNDLDVSGYINLKLDFDMYHFSIATSTAQGYVAVDYSLDSGTTWNNLTTFFNDEGNPFNWRKFSFNIPGSNFTSTQFKIKFTHFSAAASGVFYEAITTVDNVRVYGFKNITTPFNWASLKVDLYKSDCVTPVGSDLASTVCVKPTATQLEDLNWALNASATFSNGCPAIGDYTVSNDTKTWLQPGLTNWNDGPQWKPVNIPTIAKCVIVRTPVDMPTNTSGTHGFARSVIVKPGGKLNIQPKSSLTIQNYIKNEASATDVILDNDANLIQVNNAAINTGNITVKRVANLKRYDYNYWGSPVEGQNVKVFSPETAESRFYTYNESNDYFDGLFIKNLYPNNTYSLTPTVDKNTYNFIRGKGYAIRASNNLTSISTNITHQFIGVPYNGVVDIPLQKSTTGNGHNLIANPFPSNIDYYALYNYTYDGGINKNSDLIYETAYFWTNTNYNPKMQGSNYPSNLPNGTKIINNYAVLNGTGGLAAPYGFSGTGTNDVIGSTNNCPTCKVPTQNVKISQGFVVKAKKEGNLRFENGANIRTNSPNSIFFNRMSGRVAETPVNRYWLSLKTPLDFVTPLLVGYVEGASNQYEEDFDAELLVLGGDSFYTLLDDKKLGIQGKQYPFDANDVVDLGARFGLQGTYEISLDIKEGVFANGQNIYLKDHFTGMVTNLTQGSYRFDANAGQDENRFQIIYTNTTLGADDTQVKKEFTVYKENKHAVIKSTENMKTVKLYDASGKLLYHRDINGKEFRLDLEPYKTGVYIIDVVTTHHHYNRKMIK